MYYVSKVNIVRLAKCYIELFCLKMEEHIRVSVVSGGRVVVFMIQADVCVRECVYGRGCGDVDVWVFMCVGWVGVYVGVCVCGFVYTSEGAGGLVGGVLGGGRTMKKISGASQVSS